MKLLFCVLVSVMLCACNKSDVDEKEVMKMEEQSKSTREFQVDMPDCEKRDANGNYLVKGGCTEAEYKAWEQKRHNR